MDLDEEQRARINNDNRIKPHQLLGGPGWRTFLHGIWSALFFPNFIWQQMDKP